MGLVRGHKSVRGAQRFKVLVTLSLRYHGLSGITSDRDHRFLHISVICVTALRCERTSQVSNLRRYAQMDIKMEKGRVK
jgi:hypothetical protein